MSFSTVRSIAPLWPVSATTLGPVTLPALRTDRLDREIDLVARLGGDEFVAVLPMLGELRGRAAQNALTAAEKLRTALQDFRTLTPEQFCDTHEAASSQG